MAIFTILGAGMMGSALCVPLADAGHEVRLVGTHLDDEIIASLKGGGVHPTLGLALPPEVRPFFAGELGEAVCGAEAIGIGVSSAGVRWAAEQIGPHARPERPIVMVSKGLHWSGGELRLLPDVLRDALPTAARCAGPVAVAGPCIAGELARRVESCVVLASREPRAAERVAALMCSSYYHVRTSPDLAGTQVCAALKNAYAMGVGLGAGINEKSGGKPGSVAMHNFEAALFAQSVIEMQRLVAVLGGDPQSAAGLPGAGDLNVTCNGGRTARFGRSLGLGLSLAEAVAKMQGATLECLEILEVMRQALPEMERRGAIGPDELPLLRHLGQVALDGAPVRMPFARFFRSAT
ncbi:MAG: glycerol-3-phosphate dehydrogenase [Deltaproteobacteria bacterium]|nr:glycerol-3-phosphate dehydrogenase [Deltaproteobacteria bacterium]